MLLDLNSKDRSIVSSDIPMQQHPKTTYGYPSLGCIVLKRNISFMDKKSLLIVGGLNVLTKWFVKLLLQFVLQYVNELK